MVPGFAGAEPELARIGTDVTNGTDVTACRPSDPYRAHMSRPHRLVDAVLSVLRAATAPAARRSAARRPTARLRTTRRPDPLARRSSGTDTGIEVDYRPRADGRPDPGEVVWAWVPYDEGDGRGKDRPVLVIGRRGEDLVGLMLTSKDHDRDAADEARHGRTWMDVGTGGWDDRGRPSEVRLDRLLPLDPERVRREGAALDRALFDRVLAAARRTQGW
jgi:PemK-like, MazF-like toxin of type II toxin-antitoxin system